MPIFTYQCPSCKKTFDELVKNCNEEVKCPVCRERAARVWSGEMFSATGKPPKKCSGKCSECSGCG